MPQLTKAPYSIWSQGQSNFKTYTGKKNRKTFGPQEVNRFSQLCAKFQPPGGFELHATIFKKTKTMAPEVQCNLGLYVFERFSGCLAKILKKNICFYHVTLNRQIFWPNDILYKF